ncbi:lipase 3-like [Belonocnema kinseyi]|uniref:lipase 3-like n=1 Tax=Belonocnema kinseyi TaxID=2817044 RepID=UPI00143D8273|nr:lipase 3-like [Belonocnema kinseyi]
MTKNFLFFLIAFCNVIYSVSSVPEDPFRKIEEIITSNGYPFERHLVQTEDGYTIEIHRIPGGKGEKAYQAPANKPPVYVLNAFYQSSATWVSTGPRISLAYLLADNGFDVWLGNCRGNIFARNHTTYVDLSYGFWNFSWHEMGLYDMPAAIDFILEITGRSQLYYGCHSQGCTAAYVLGALKPEYNKKIRFSAHMGPIAFLGNMKGIGRILAPIIAKLGTPFLEKVGHFSMTGNALITIIFRQILLHPPWFAIVFSAIYTFSGPSKLSDNREAIENGLPYTITGASTKQIVHYAQGVLNPYTFRQYDYGSVQNLKIYNSVEPPSYPLEKVTMPIAFIEGTNDFCANKLDLDYLAKKLPNVVGRFVYPLNHLDFAYNRNIKQLGYNKIVELFLESEKRAS